MDEHCQRDSNGCHDGEQPECCTCDCDICVGHPEEPLATVCEAAGLLEAAARGYAGGDDTPSAYVLRLCESMREALALADKVTRGR